MKKIFFSLLTLLLLASCANKDIEEGETHITSIVSPSGAPSLSLLPILNNDQYKIDIVDGADVLQAEFVTANSDIIIAPINLGTKLSENTGNYYLYSVATTSNLYLISNKTQIKTIAAFQEEAVPGKVLKYLTEYFDDVDIEYFTSVNEAVAAYSNGQYDSVIAAYPVVNKLLKNEKNKVINLLDLYKEKSGYDNYPQAAIFVSKDYFENHNGLLLETYDLIYETNKRFKESNEEYKNFLESNNIDILGFADISLISNSYNELGLNIIKINDYLNETKQFLDLFNIELSDSILIN